MVTDTHEQTPLDKAVQLLKSRRDWAVTSQCADGRTVAAHGSDRADMRVPVI